MNKTILTAFVLVASMFCRADVEIAIDAQTEEEKIMISKDEFEALTNAVLLAQAMWDKFNDMADMRVKIHGGVDHEEVDVINMVKRIYYKDGYIYTEPFHKKQTRAQEYGIGDKDSKAQQTLEKNMPERLKEIRRHRRRKLATTNEVTIVTHGGIN